MLWPLLGYIISRARSHMFRQCSCSYVRFRTEKDRLLANLRVRILRSVPVVRINDRGRLRVARRPVGDADEWLDRINRNNRNSGIGQARTDLPGKGAVPGVSSSFGSVITVSVHSSGVILYFPPVLLFGA